MGSKQISIIDSFSQSSCSVCGCREVNQFFNINDNFIDYCGIFYPLKEILCEALDLQVDNAEGKAMEVCLDCKDKVVKFYHFKRRVKEVQKRNRSREFIGNRSEKTEKHSKVVHSIYKIIENYTEKCSITAIKVDENSKKLIIEPNDGKSRKSKSKETYDVFEEPETDVLSETVIIKEEPLSGNESLAYTSHFMDNSLNENYSSEETETSEYDASTTTHFLLPSTSKNNSTMKKRKIDVNQEDDESGEDYAGTKSFTIHSKKGKKISKKQSPESLKKFQTMMFTNRRVFLNDYYNIVDLSFSETEVKKTKFSNTKFKQVNKYRAECLICKTLLWMNVTTTYGLKRHMKLHEKKPEEQEQEHDHEPEHETKMKIEETKQDLNP